MARPLESAGSAPFPWSAAGCTHEGDHYGRSWHENVYAGVATHRMILPLGERSRFTARSPVLVLGDRGGEERHFSVELERHGGGNCFASCIIESARSAFRYVAPGLPDRPLPLAADMQH